MEDSVSARAISRGSEVDWVRGRGLLVVFLAH